MLRWPVAPPGTAKPCFGLMVVPLGPSASHDFAVDSESNRVSRSVEPGKGGGKSRQHFQTASVCLPPVSLSTKGFPQSAPALRGATCDPHLHLHGDDGRIPLAQPMVPMAVSPFVTSVAKECVVLTALFPPACTHQPFLFNFV